MGGKGTTFFLFYQINQGVIARKTHFFSHLFAFFFAISGICTNFAQNFTLNH